LSRALIESVTGEYERYKGLGEAVIDQLTDEQLSDEESGLRSSVATLIWHISGNLRSRFTDFLTSDGEKPWRDRESEFESRQVTRTEVFEKWEEGWQVLFSELQKLQDDDLSRTVTIRGFPLTVHEALHRSLAHTSYHVGQMVYAGRWLRGTDWRWLSIPPGQSQLYDRRGEK
jgi:uncharacterized damage-inducible protein DinB